jgi:hypothetical protein
MESSVLHDIHGLGSFDQLLYIDQMLKLGHPWSPLLGLLKCSLRVQKLVNETFCVVK